MMLSASPSSIVRSSLEEMLDSLRRRDEEEKPKDLPPALPARPTSRARLPSARRSLPSNFTLDGDCAVAECLQSKLNAMEESKRKDTNMGQRRKGSFGSKRIKKDAESPYAAAKRENINKASSKDPASAYSASVASSLKEPDWHDSVNYFIKKKLRVWCKQPHGQWGLGMIQSTSGEEAFVSLPNGNVMKVTRAELLPANPDILDGVDDLVKLSYLNEPSVLQNLRFRYSHEMIYSKAGPVLLAFNPFKGVDVYGNEYVTAYRQKHVKSPHVYAVADAAYNEMMGDEVNQSIIISGESGSGKTETAKIAMQYLAALGGGSRGIENEVLQANYILEAFGNAKTLRNDNSSRYGKLVEIQFSTVGKICGAKIQTFLLEKSRVVQMASGERSYHIFYQLCAGSSPVLKERLNLRVANEYRYLNQSDCMTIDGVDDAKNFDKLMKALDAVRIWKDDQELVFKMLAAILWLGNVSFQVIDNEKHVEVVDDKAVTSAAQLMGCSPLELMVTLSTHKNQGSKDTVSKKLTLQEAIDTRDALATFIYSSLFDWLVEQVNKSLEVSQEHTGRSVSILDIYGFESFKKNNFEQFCINYANERLQQHFNLHLFKLEHEDYELDGIDWAKVDFEDNQECLDLFEKKPSGILSLLDEESKNPKATDLTFANKLKQHLNANPCFKGERGRAFGVCHYAGEVLYDTNGFLDKNRDALPFSSIQFLSSSSCALLQLFAAKMLALDPEKQSLGTRFKDQLFKLMSQLENTTPHFIRCIRPNTKQLPGLYDEDLVLQQITCCGVLEVVRISKTGYPTRMTHQEFAGRYGFLLPDANVSQDPLSVSVAVLQQFNIPPEMYQVGFTKLYLRTGQIGALDDRRKQVMQGILMVQKCFRGHQARLHFHKLKKNGVTTLPSCNAVVRGGENARRKYELEDIQAIILLQSLIRGWLVRRHVSGMHKLKKSHENTKPKRKSRLKMSEVKDMPKQQVLNLPSALLELQRRVVKAEATLEQKEQENNALREQLKQSETRWTEYEMKMKSMEEVWQKQMVSLQTSLAAARKSLAAEQSTGQPGRHDNVLSPRGYDSEDVTSMGSRTPGGSTPIKFSSNLSDAGTGREPNGTLAAVNNLIKEFEQQRQTFDDDAKALVGIKSGHSANMNPDEEFRRIKHRFEEWKKEYKVRLRETKARLHKVGNPEVERSRRKWWGRFSYRAA